MSLTLTASLVLSALFLATSVTAAPTRTHCRCTLVSDAPPPAIYTPSSAHWAPSEPSPSPSTADICFNLGVELENFQHTQPDLYDLYIDKSKIPNGHGQLPMTTTVLLSLAHEHKNEPRPTSRPQQRIVCHTEIETFIAYQSSFVNLWALHIIVAVSILACLAEGVHIGLQWMHQRNQDCSAEIPEKSSLRLAGAEKRLLAIPTVGTEADQVFSPGAEKKLRAYASTRYLITHSSSGRREFIAYEEDDDDEVNRPVM